MRNLLVEVGVLILGRIGDKMRSELQLQNQVGFRVSTTWKSEYEVVEQRMADRRWKNTDRDPKYWASARIWLSGNGQ